MVQHLASAVGAFMSARTLTELGDGTLVGMARVAMVSVALSLSLPMMVAAVASRVQRRERSGGEALVPRC